MKAEELKEGLVYYLEIPNNFVFLPERKVHAIFIKKDFVLNGPGSYDLFYFWNIKEKTSFALMHSNVEKFVKDSI